MTTSVYALTTLDWKKTFEMKGFSPTSLPFWLDGLYKDQSWWNRHIADTVIQTFKAELNFSLPCIAKILESDDGTVKFQMRFEDELEVETVLLPFHKRYTVCLSTQVGCAMNCSFCFTGTQGLK